MKVLQEWAVGLKFNDSEKKKWTTGAHLLLKCYLQGKISRKLANGQNIDYSEKIKWPKGFICLCTGVKYHNIQICYWYMKQISGERLQDHWSSGFFMCL